MKIFLLQILTVLVLLLAGANILHAYDVAEDYSSFLFATSIDGPTGLLGIPSTQEAMKGGYSSGIHKYNLKLNYGLIPNLEIGVMLDLQEVEDFSKDELKTIAINAKYRVLREERHFIDLAAGKNDENLYIIASKYFPNLERFAFHLGLQETDADAIKGMWGITKIARWSMFMLDYDGISYNFGVRMLLSEKMKLDFALVELKKDNAFGFDTFMFGLSFSE